MIKIIEEFKPENTVRPSHKMATDAEDVYFTKNMVATLPCMHVRVCARNITEITI